jgi:hypothetical protein
MAAMNKRLLISESRDDLNQCTPCQGKPDQHDTYASHTSPRMPGVHFLRTVPVRSNLSHWPNRVGQIHCSQLVLPGPYHWHAIGTFNTCSRVPTPQSLTDTGGGYHIEKLRIAIALSPSFPSEGSTDPPNGPARSQIIHNNYQLNWRGKKALNLASGSLHSTSTVTYHLRIAWANDVPPR